MSIKILFLQYQNTDQRQWDSEWRYRVFSVLKVHIPIYRGQHETTGIDLGLKARQLESYISYRGVNGYCVKLIDQEVGL